MAKPWLSTVEKLTEFFSTDQIEASARRTKFVQRTSKITGKLFLALVTFGRWSAAKTTVAQLAAKAAHLDEPVDITPEALQQRMTVRAVAFLRELVQTAFTKLHSGDTICEEGIFCPVPPRPYCRQYRVSNLPRVWPRNFPGRAAAAVERVRRFNSCGSTRATRLMILHSSPGMSPITNMWTRWWNWPKRTRCFCLTWGTSNWQRLPQLRPPRPIS